MAASRSKRRAWARARMTAPRRRTPSTIRRADSWAQVLWQQVLANTGRQPVLRQRGREGGQEASGGRKARRWCTMLCLNGGEGARSGEVAWEWGLGGARTPLLVPLLPPRTERSAGTAAVWAGVEAAVLSREAARRSAIRRGAGARGGWGRLARRLARRGEKHSILGLWSQATGWDRRVRPRATERGVWAGGWRMVRAFVRRQRAMHCCQSCATDWICSGLT